MKQLTVNDLFKSLQKEIKKGNGDKLIVLSNDEEGNGYRGLYYGITSGSLVKECIQISNGVSDSESVNPDDLVILG